MVQIYNDSEQVLGLLRELKSAVNNRGAGEIPNFVKYVKNLKNEKKITVNTYEALMKLTRSSGSKVFKADEISDNIEAYETTVSLINESLPGIGIVGVNNMLQRLKEDGLKPWVVAAVGFTYDLGLKPGEVIRRVGRKIGADRIPPVEDKGAEAKEVLNILNEIEQALDSNNDPHALVETYSKKLTKALNSKQINGRVFSSSINLIRTHAAGALDEQTIRTNISQYRQAIDYISAWQARNIGTLGVKNIIAQMQKEKKVTKYVMQALRSTYGLTITPEALALDQTYSLAKDEARRMVQQQ